MPNVVTSFTRKRDTTARQSTTHPRHRRDGYFDEQDQWHDATEATTTSDTHASA
jgi:hypothetical protein